MNTLSKSLVAVLMTAIAGLAVAGHGDKGDRHHAWMAKKLDLTEQQSEEIKAIREQAKGEGQALREEMQALREDMKAQLSKDNYDAAAVEQLAARKGEAVRKKTILKAQTMHAISQVLTPEQRAKAQEMRERHGKKKRGHRKHGKHHADEME